MKRSEATEKLKFIIEEEFNIEISDYDAFNVMQQLLDMGMLPPSSKEVCFNMQDDKVGESFVCCWEPEDKDE